MYKVESEEECKIGFDEITIQEFLRLPSPRTRMFIKLRGEDICSANDIRINGNPLSENMKISYPLWIYDAREYNNWFAFLEIDEQAEFIVEEFGMHCRRKLSGVAGKQVQISRIAYKGKTYELPSDSRGSLYVNNSPIKWYSSDELLLIEQRGQYTLSLFLVEQATPNPESMIMFDIVNRTFKISRNEKYQLSDELLQFATDKDLVDRFVVCEEIFDMELCNKLLKFGLNIEILVNQTKR